MAKQDFETLFGSSISDSKIIMEKVKNMPNCFVGWVESYNADNNTVNIQPAIQQYVSNSDKNGQNYANAPLLANVWVVGDNTEEIKKGDKALCFVLDQKSNAFFKATYDSTNSLARQTFKPLTNARKNITDCVAIILGNTSQIADGSVTLSKLSQDVQDLINPYLIYDYSSSDPAINLGYPNGIYGKSGTITEDLSAYTIVVFYLKYAINVNAIVRAYLKAPTASGQTGGDTLKYSNVSMTESLSGSRYACRIIVPFDFSSFQIQDIGYYSSTNSWNSRNTPLYGMEYCIYRIEGFK